MGTIELLEKEFTDVPITEINSLGELSKLILEKYSKISEFKPELTDQEYLEKERIKIISLKHRFIAIANEVTQKKYIIDADNKEIISNLFGYFMNTETELNKKKWLWIYGGLGVGKTDMIRAFLKLKAESKPTFEYTYSHVNHIIRAIQNKEKTDSNYINIPCLFLDDVGTESKEQSYYGERKNAIDRILQERYDLRHHPKFLTIVTTNNTLSQFEQFEHYDKRTIDRIRESYNFIHLKGKNKRNLK